jgi:regulator of protease activity HflC (stomatin/prohibitin superfamily)
MPIQTIIISLFVLFILVSGIFVVKQQTAVIIERLGKFLAIRNAGLHFKIPFIDRKAGSMNLRIQQLDVVVETKTKDNVFIEIKVSVQYKVMPEAIFSAFYKLDNATDQITAYVFDTVRAEVPKMKLDDVFEKKDDIAIALRRELEEAMQEYGFTIIKALVTDINPDKEVKHAMNRINAAERQKIAAEYEGESERIRIVAKAKAEAESKHLQGIGIADQRRAIAKGLEDSVSMLNNAGINSQEASALIVITQHYDTLHSLGEHSNSNLILLPNSPSSASNMLNDMVTSMVAAQNISEKTKQVNQKRNQA